MKEKYIIVEKQDIRFLVYIEEGQLFSLKDIVYIKGDIYKIEKDLDIDVFEFADYLKNKRVFYGINAYETTLIDGNNSISEKIIKFLLKNVTDESYNMSKMLLFNDKYVDEISYENLTKINAIHLFVVSGFHISFLYNLIDKIVKKQKILSIVLGFSICLFYVYLLNFSISATRAVISLILSKTLSKHLNVLDTTSIAGFIILLIEPLNVYSFSFIMSFTVTITIIFVSKLISKYNKLIQSLLISFFCFVVMIPIQLLLNYEINFVSLISNFILSYVVIVIFVLCILGIIFSFIHGNIFGFIYIGFNYVISYISSLKSTLLFGSVGILFLIFFYLGFVALLLAIEYKKKIYTLLASAYLFLMMVGLYFKDYLNPFQRVTFLNVMQGDCCIIQDSFSDKVMLIDTGGNVNYDIASKKIIPYLKYHGIDSIDIIVITHDDYDHNGALESLNNQIEIDEIITDKYREKVNLGKIELININKFFDENSDKNDSSIVLYGAIGEHNFLFTGDISKSIENKMIEHYDTLDVDVLKVAHHGSNTSTSNVFVKFISPQYSIISVGKNNHYGHPSFDVIDELEKNGSIIYRTDQNGTIRFVIKNDKLYFIETAK